MEPVCIVSDRVVLRALALSDSGRLYEAVNESRRELGEWLEWCREGYSPADAVDWIERTLRPEVYRQLRSFGVFGRGEGGALLGCVGLSNIDWAGSTANLGYWIRTGECGKGYAREAAAAMAGYARSSLGLARVEIAVHPLNEKSARVARAVGAREEGLVAGRIVHQGVPAEACVFSL